MANQSIQKTEQQPSSSKEILLFERMEKKYLITNEQYLSISKSLEDYMIAGKYGKYTICNVYFDNESYNQIILSLLKPTYKQKVRLRCYGVPKDNDRVFLEIKKKYQGVVYKRRITAPYKRIMQYINAGEKPLDVEDISFNEIDYTIKHLNLKPKVFLAYDRMEYVCKTDPTLRITFDNNIRSRIDNIDLQAGDHGKPLPFNGDYIMEVKANRAMPFWLCRLINENNAFPSSFSKYGNVYLNLIKGEK